jgi:hypothetical protein
LAFVIQNDKKDPRETEKKYKTTQEQKRRKTMIPVPSLYPIKPQKLG